MTALTPVDVRSSSAIRGIGRSALGLGSSMLRGCASHVCGEAEEIMVTLWSHFASDNELAVIHLEHGGHVFEEAEGDTGAAREGAKANYSLLLTDGARYICGEGEGMAMVARDGYELVTTHPVHGHLCNHLEGGAEIAHDGFGDDERLAIRSVSSSAGAKAS
ncbi:MAG: hypothetical protein OXF02_04580 [Simkaniaceae bacterium]|nr:hypothetical protein [Simkaniaceae bacterium]